MSRKLADKGWMFKILFSVCYILDLDLANLKIVLSWLTNYRRTNLFNQMLTESEFAQYQKDLTEIKSLINQIEKK